MMPYCARDPPSHYYVLHLPWSLPVNAVEADSPSSVKIYYATPFLRSWRRGKTALMLIWTLLMFLTMLTAFADGLRPNPIGFESELDRSAVESETGSWPTTSNYSKFIRVPHEWIRKRTKRGLTSMNQQQSVPSLNDQPRRLQPTGHGPDRRFTFSDGRRVLVSTACTNKDISIFQSSDGSSGIPRYAVQIMNNCMADCAPSNIHVYCGWFASALLVNPNSFRRIAFDDCIVNGGRPLKHGETLRFTYANSFMYQLKLKSASFCK